MADTEYHAKLSPSGAHRWMACPGSIVLGEQYPDTSSAYSREGTAAHTLASMVLRSSSVINADDFLDEHIRVEEDRIRVTKDMVRYVQMYVDYVREAAQGKMLFIETAVPIGHLTGEQGATGTADAIIVDAHNRAITIVDLKYGAGVAVDAEDNFQMQMYALGALEECDMLADFETVTMVIHQPRVREEASEWTVSRSDLRVFANEVAAAADTVRAAASRRDPASSAWIEAYLHPGEKQCKFCVVPKHECPAYRAVVMETLGAPAATAEDFAALVLDPVDENTSDNWLPVVMSRIDLIEQFCKSVRAETERRLIAGKTVDGFKLVRGREGPRKWSDPDAAEELLKSFRLKVDEMYDKKVISPTTAEKILKSTPKRWDKAQELVTRSEGSLSVAPASDKRQAVVLGATAAEFAALLETE